MVKLRVIYNDVHSIRLCKIKFKWSVVSPCSIFEIILLKKQRNKLAFLPRNLIKCIVEKLPISQQNKYSQGL